MDCCLSHQILKREESAGGMGCAVAVSRYLNWHPRLDCIFHRMMVSLGRQADATRLKSRGKHRRLSTIGA
jgi:hypothetical protein